jgi:hypothetical protein
MAMNVALDRYGYLVDLCVASLIVGVFLIYSVLRIHKSRFLIKTSRAALFILLARLSGSLILSRLAIFAIVRREIIKATLLLIACFAIAGISTPAEFVIITYLELFILGCLALFGPDFDVDENENPTHCFNRDWAMLACALRATGVFTLMFLDLDFYIMIAFRVITSLLEQLPDSYSNTFVQNLNTLLNYDLSAYSSEFWRFWRYISNLFLQSDGIEPFLYYLKYDFLMWMNKKSNEFLAHALGSPAPSFADLCPAQNINTCLSSEEVRQSVFVPDLHFRPYFSISQVFVMKVHEFFEELMHACISFTVYVAQGLITFLPNIPIN